MLPCQKSLKVNFLRKVQFKLHRDSHEKLNYPRREPKKLQNSLTVSKFFKQINKFILESEIFARCTPLCEYFTAERPFYYAIMDKNTIFFSGRFVEAVSETDY